MIWVNFKKLLVLFLVLMASVLTIGSLSYANTIINNQVIVRSGETSTTYDLDKVKWERENGEIKVCICRMLCFRALQTLASRFPDRIIPRDDLKIITGWTTDGPEEQFVKEMGWPSEDLLVKTGATDPKYLTIKDAVFYFIRKSTGEAWEITADKSIYPKEFFTYRTLIKTGEAGAEQKSFFKNALRPQAVADLELLPIIDKFDLTPVLLYQEDGVIHIPIIITSSGISYTLELEYGGSNIFMLNTITEH